MWAQYRRSALPLQCLILSICVALVLSVQVSTVGVLTFLAMMELGAVAGAWWSARSQRRGPAPADALET